MVDPSTQKPCPACGRKVPTNDMGQTHTHSGCPFTGNGLLQSQDIYPLKFASRPAATLAVASEREWGVATIRHDFEYADQVEVGDHFSLRPAKTKRALGIGEVTGVIPTTVNDAYMKARESSALYPVQTRRELLDILNTFYDDDIRIDTEADLLFFSPTLADY